MIIVRRVVGHSMEPALEEGQFIVALKSVRIKTGDLVIGRHEGKEVIKMISREDDERAFLSGNNPEHDLGWISKSNLIARVVWPRG